MFPLMVLKFVWLKTLNASPRSCSRVLSPKRMFLNREKSTRFVGGPLMTPRPPLPMANCAVPEVGFGWRHAVLKY